MDETLFKEPNTTSQLQVLILTGDFRRPDVCSSRHGGAQAIQSVCPGNVSLTEVPNRPTRAGLLDVLLTGTKELVGNVAADGSLGCSGDQ